jgi:hypothetical protein
VHGTASARSHSRYVRTLADFPWQGIPVTLRLRVRRFFCEEPACERVIFAERLPRIVAHYARSTVRLDRWLDHVSFALGGEAGAKLLRELPGVKVSGDTLLAHIRSLDLGRGANTEGVERGRLLIQARTLLGHHPGRHPSGPELRNVR